MPIGTVITADIVNSTFLSKAVFNKLIKTIDSLIGKYKNEFYRGDSFQVYLKENEKALHLALIIRLAAKRIEMETGNAADVRVAIGIGHINTPVRIMKTSGEEPFVLSGRSFDELTSGEERIVIKSFDDEANCIFRIIARFVDYIFKDITAKQAAVIFELLMGSTQTDAAKRLKKSQVTINKQVHAAGWREIEKLLMDYTNAFHQFNLK
ncbi:MAG: adenylate/guanylate cyclase domain-containing protein [Bacteroidetes bacterium]|jgi:hypothetical protein|nr:MAG: adenylate/guanylate cyclase domain-containing protein [Bacteroidota bacterium]